MLKIYNIGDWSDNNDVDAYAISTNDNSNIKQLTLGQNTFIVSNQYNTQSINPASGYYEYEINNNVLNVNHLSGNHIGCNNYIREFTNGTPGDLIDLTNPISNSISEIAIFHIIGSSNSNYWSFAGTASLVCDQVTGVDSHHAYSGEEPIEVMSKLYQDETQVEWNDEQNSSIIFISFTGSEYDLNTGEVTLKVQAGYPHDGGYREFTATGKQITISETWELWRPDPNDFEPGTPDEDIYSGMEWPKFVLTVNVTAYPPYNI